MALPAFPQSDSPVGLIVPGGRPLRVALATDSTVKKVGQMVTGTLVEPIYAYDRLVLPAGTKVEGRITKLDNPSKLNRAQTMGSGDFSPHHIVELRFEAVIRDGERVPIDTIAKNETVHPTRQAAKDAASASPNPGVRDRAEPE